MSTTLAATKLPAPGTYVIDPAHSSVEFVARHMMVTKVRGRFNEFDGAIHVAATAEESWAEATIVAGSIDTRSEQRDAHLRSAEFLDVERFPELRFRSTSLQPAGEGRWKAVGDLTIRDVTRPVELDVEFGGTGTNPWGVEVAFLSATAEIDREDFGITWNQTLETGGVLVSKKVRLEIEAQVSRKSE